MPSPGMTVPHGTMTLRHITSLATNASQTLMAPPPSYTLTYQVTMGRGQQERRLTQRGWQIESGFGWLDHARRLAVQDACAVAPDTAVGLITSIRWCVPRLLTSGIPETFVRRCGVPL
jgi:hypothetical protein